ncbi:MAG: histidinol-phosphate aminotransferase family protein [Methanospirillaceae archaeon]|nr:histidinol-phosphate aminotransferase family protein [Methanospirillaceae archaeon]
MHPSDTHESRAQYMEDLLDNRHGGQVKRFREEFNGSFLEFSASLNPISPKLTVPSDTTAIKEYPDDSFTKLKMIIARFHNRNPDEVVVGNGSAEIIRSFCHAVLQNNATAHIPGHSFGEYAQSARICGATVSRNTSGAAATFLCNPNNPTGELCRRDDILAYGDDVHKEGGILFVDEAFLDLARPKESIADVSSPHLFVMRSLTKSFAIPGIRFGYGLGDPSLVAMMEMIRPPWSVNAIAEEMAIEAFSHINDLCVSRSYIRRERSYLLDQFFLMDLLAYPASANFILLRIKSPVARVCSAMVQRGILIRDCTSFGLPDCIRVAVMRHEENRQLVEALRQCLQ